MGGMHGFGPVDPTDAAAFHEDWEPRVLGVRMAVLLAGRGNGDLRPFIERIPPAIYLADRYYERWARAVEASAVDAGLITPAEVDARAAAMRGGGESPPRRTAAPAAVRREVASTIGTWIPRPRAAPARFAAGDRVRVRRGSPAGHTRCPRYVRGVTGTVERVLGAYRRPDPGDHPLEQTYTVGFAMRDLWGDDAEPGTLYLDLWEGYLE